MKKFIIVLLVGLLVVFSTSFVKNAKTIDNDFYTKNNYVRVVEENDIFYIVSDDLPNLVDNIIINNYNEFNVKTADFYIHLDSKYGSYTFKLENFDEKNIRFTTIDYTDFLKDELLLSRYNHKNKKALAKEVLPFAENYLDIDSGNSDFFIDKYSPTYYSAVDIVKKVDDPVLELIPKRYFHSEGEKMFFGQEYAYYIRTTEYHGTEIGLKYKSLVTVFDIESAPFIYDTKMLKKPVDLIAEASPKYYGYFAFNQAFSCYYNTYYRDMMSEYDWNLSYFFSDELYSITINSGKKFYNKDELMPFNFKYSFGFDSFGTEYSAVNEQMEECFETVAATTFLGDSPKSQIGNYDFLKYAKYLKLTDAKAKAILSGLHTAFECVDKLYNYYLDEKANNRLESISNMVAGTKNNNHLIGNEFSDYYQKLKIIYQLQYQYQM